MGNENAERIQTSLLNGIEKRVLVWIADRLPAWVTSDMLTYLGVAGAVLYAAFCWMAQCNVNYFWFAFLGLVITWFGGPRAPDPAPQIRLLYRPLARCPHHMPLLHRTRPVAADGSQHLAIHHGRLPLPLDLHLSLDNCDG